jgi:hypothetical protein
MEIKFRLQTINIITNEENETRCQEQKNAHQAWIRENLLSDQPNCT